jgi:ribosomal protein L32
MTQIIDTLPMRDGSRDGASGCLVCGAPLASPRARYCSRAHQQRAFRLRHQTSLPDLQRLRQELQRRHAVVAQTVYECSSCGERLVDERRCPHCNLFSRAIGLGGHCPDCDTPLLLVDLLGEEVARTP